MKNSLLLTTILSLLFAARSGGAYAQNPGSLDLSFDPGSGANGEIKVAAIQSDGRILIAGGFTAYNGTPRYRIARLNSDGSIDGTFVPGLGANGEIRVVSVQSDGKIVIGGQFWSYSGTPRHCIARLNEDGSLDLTFNPAPGVGSLGFGVFASAIQSDGKILIGGFFDMVNGISRNGIARLNADGSLDETFDPGVGVGPDETEAMVSSMAIQSDGKIWIGGNFSTYNGTPTADLVRLNEDGSMDTAIADGVAWEVRVISIQDDGGIVIGGLFTSRIRRLNPNGELDMTFDPGSGFSGPTWINVWAIAIEDDGRIVVGGAFWSYNGTPRNNIARLNPDGSLDMTFDPGSGANDAVYVSAIQSDGRIILGGRFTSYNGTARNHIARLNSEGIVGQYDVAQNAFAISPNPASFSVTINLPEQPSRAEFILRNAQAQVVLRSTLASGRNEVPLSGLAPGLYAVEVSTATGHRTERLVVQ